MRQQAGPDCAAERRAAGLIDTVRLWATARNARRHVPTARVRAPLRGGGRPPGGRRRVCGATIMLPSRGSAGRAPPRAPLEAVAQSRQPFGPPVGSKREHKSRSGSSRAHKRTVRCHRPAPSPAAPLRADIAVVQKLRGGSGAAAAAPAKKFCDEEGHYLWVKDEKLEDRCAPPPPPPPRPVLPLSAVPPFADRVGLLSPPVQTKWRSSWARVRAATAPPLARAAAGP